MNIYIYTHICAYICIYVYGPNFMAHLVLEVWTPPPKKGAHLSDARIGRELEGTTGEAKSSPHTKRGP